MTTSKNGIKNNPLIYLFSKVWEYSKGNRKKVVLYWVMFIIAESIEVFCMPLIWAKIVEVITNQGIDANSLKFLQIILGVVFSSVFVIWALHGPARVMELTNAFKTKINYRRYLTQGLLTLPIEWHVDHHSGETIDKCEKGTSALNDFSNDSFEFIYSIVKLIGCYGMLVYFSPSASYIVLGMMIISAWITIRIDKVLLEQYRQINKSENKISESIFDAISNISTIIILRVEKLVFDAIMHKVEEPLELVVKTNKLNEFKWFLVSVVAAIMKVLVLLFFFYKNFGAKPGVLTSGVYILITYLNQIGELFFNFAGMYGYVVRRKTRVMNSEEVAQDFGSENFTNHVLPSNWRSLDIKNIKFFYSAEEQNKFLLDNISLKIMRGERLAFVGETGSGKSTMLHLIRDLRHPNEIDLSVNMGRNDSEVVNQKIPEGFGGVSRAIALVPQNPEIFATTILTNITMGAEHDIEKVYKFTDLAMFTEVANSLPKKFESSIREKGVNLSGGQKQRLALSRGLLACENKEIILLDEPTSSLDVVTEINVYKNIFTEFKGKTVIATIHQIHLLPMFDRICVFDKGKIVGMGTIQELLETCPRFVSLWLAMKNAAEGNFQKESA